MDVYIDPSGVLLLIGLLGLLVLAVLWAPDPAAEHDSPSTLEEPGNADLPGLAKDRALVVFERGGAGDVPAGDCLDSVAR